MILLMPSDFSDFFLRAQIYCLFQFFFLFLLCCNCFDLWGLQVSQAFRICSDPQHGYKGYLKDFSLVLLVQHTSFHSYNTRYKHDLHATHINTKSYGSKTMSYKGRQYWNHSPPELKNQEKTKPFNSELKKRCLQKYID